MLNSQDVQAVSGAGVVAAIVALPSATAMGIGATLPAVCLAPFVVARGKTLYEGLKNGLYQTTLGIQIGYALEKAAYDW
jgi:hypothetical protein